MNVPAEWVRTGWIDRETVAPREPSAQERAWRALEDRRRRVISGWTDAEIRRLVEAADDPCGEIHVLPEVVAFLRHELSLRAAEYLTLMAHPDLAEIS